MQELSAYETEREANIARNRALLEQLDLKDASSSLALPPKPKPKPKSKPKPKPVQHVKRPKRTPATEPPRRHSVRLQQQVINETRAQKRKREAEVEKLRMEEEDQIWIAEQQDRAAKRPRKQALNLAVLTGANQAEMGALRGVFRSATSAPIRKRVGSVRDWVFDNNSTAEREVEGLRKRLGKMRIVARAKVSDSRVYSAAYHPEPSKDLVFFGDKHGQLGIWDARALPDEVADEDGDVTSSDKGGKCWHLQQHWPANAKSSISCIKFDPIDSHSVVTTSYDCTVRRLSFVSSISHQILSTDALITSIDLSPAGHEMWISDASGGLTHYDLRESGKSAQRYQLSDLKIGSVSVNPTSIHLLVTASNNRLLRLWDTRKLQALTHGPDVKRRTSRASSASPARPTPLARGSSEYDHNAIQGFLDTAEGRGLLRAEFRHGKSASSAFWDPRGRSIVSTSYDDTVNLWELDASKYDSSPLFPSFSPFSRIKHNCQTGHWVTILRAIWNPNPNVYPHFTIANMNHSVDIFSCKGDLITTLSDPEQITAVQAVTCSHPSIVERCATGNGSGRCVLWASPDI